MRGTLTPRAAGITREIAFPVLAVVAIVGYADIRIPMGLPGHRGLIWLTLLVAVVLATHRRATVLAVGAAATIATVAIHGSTRYLAAAILLYLVAAVARRQLAVLAAAPIHLVAVTDSLMFVPEKLWFHLGFGLAAGLLGWAIAWAIGMATGNSS
ncbi:hypothetical protein A5634_10480 [Mycobacterium asiaticum]|uniref:Uncharacterized protein n=1 Tax=Mycobacterium asiaticum TaxID=1790 RepID=A0A1A3NJR6_MYCAS|nr:hypothetical protein A5634_10480 [Mycobacterium asiaticum]